MDDTRIFHYRPPPTLKRFMLDDHLARFVVGPVGSGKTTAMVMEIFRRACLQEAGPSGIRPSRWVAVRNTRPQLVSATLPDILSLLSPFAVWHPSDSRVDVEVDLEDGTRVDLEIWLVPLETPDDIRRLLSLQLSGVWLSEFREIDVKVVPNLLARIGRYPKRELHGADCTHRCLIAESNSFSIASPWYELLVTNRPDDWAFFRQPSALSPEAENIENLPPGYYEKLAASADEDWIRVYLANDFGIDLTGEPVWGRLVDPDRHLSDKLEPIIMRPVMLAQDFGRTPATLFCQITSEGTLVVLDEVYTENNGIERHFDQYVMPLLNGRYKGATVWCVADPAGIYKDQVGEVSPIVALQNRGIRTVPARTNNVDARINAVATLLNRQIGKRPGLMINKTRCPLLVRAIMQDYRYRRNKNEKLEEVPEKSHPASDLADALSYAALATLAGVEERVLQHPRLGEPWRFNKRPDRYKPRTVPVGAWT